MGSEERGGITPTWSHGGPGSVSYPVVSGGQNGAGSPISLINYGSLGVNWPVLCIIPWTGSGGPIGNVTMTVFVEANPGPLILGIPDPNAWCDQTNGTGIVYAGTALPKTVLVNPALPFWRTRIAGYASGWLESRLGPIQLASGRLVTAGNPEVKGGGPPPFTFSQ